MGYIGGLNAVKEVYSGLERLEYRGYDSAGIAILNEDITIFKRAGRVQKLKALIEGAKAPVAIGHTRWATHGKPSDINAHPHSAGDIAIVHNGIIENYARLKEELISEGAGFSSETDSEVAAVLIQKNLSTPTAEGLKRALVACAERLEGAYAIMAVCRGVEGIAVAKCKSPIVLGLGGEGGYVASDEPALAGKCPYLCFLEDGDFAFITKKGVEIFDKNLNAVEREKVINRARPAALELGDCPHYMLKELRQSPAAVKNTISAFADAREGLCACLQGVEKVIFTGCGTAYHAALAGKYYTQKFTRLWCSAEYAGELRYNPPFVDKKTALVAVTQSGETADTLEAARLFSGLGAKVIAVTNSPHSQITRLSHCVAPVAAGTEICVAATKSYSGQVTALYLLARQLERTAPKNTKYILKNETGELAPETAGLPDIIKRTIEGLDMRGLAAECAKSSGVYFLGRGADYAVALEGSLKLKEVSYLPSSGYPAGELKHGPLALIDGDALCIFIVCDGELAAKTSSAVYEVMARGAKAAVITCIDEVAEQFKGRAKVTLLPKCPDYLAPPVAAAALHILAYETAILLGRNPDRPRNLAKSVTVE